MPDTRFWVSCGIVAATIIHPTGAKAATSDLAPLLGFKQATNCTESNAFARILGKLFRYDGATGRVIPGRLITPRGYARAFGNATYSRNDDGMGVTVPINGLWHGLKLRSFHSYAWNNGEPSGWSFSFDESPEKVHNIVNQFGFALPENGERVISDDPYGQTIFVRREDNSTLFGSSTA